LILMKDEPVHVESVSTDEIAENLTESPGNVASIFLELPGMHVESVAPGLGSAAMQLRGMPSRDTLVLVDGLPLLGAEPDGFGILQTPPLDLERAEVIKGAASALYGASGRSHCQCGIARGVVAGALCTAGDHSCTFFLRN